jgi:hypothetical protein
MSDMMNNSCIAEMTNPLENTQKKQMNKTQQRKQSYKRLISIAEMKEE